MDHSDEILLQRFILNRDEKAFAHIVDQHLGLVRSVALRIVGDEARARDITQQTFIQLARDARKVRSKKSLVGWLHSVSRTFALKMLRDEKARKNREMKFTGKLSGEATPAPTWEIVSPVLDDVVANLPMQDRQLILARYYEDQPLKRVAMEMGISEEAARKRLARSLERLRAGLARRGIESSATALATLMPAYAVGPVPSGMSTSICSAALLTTAQATTFTSSVISTIIIMTKNTTIMTGIAVLLIGTGIMVYSNRGNQQGKSTTSPVQRLDKTSPEMLRTPLSGRTKKRTAKEEEFSKKYGESRTRMAKNITANMQENMKHDFSDYEARINKYISDGSWVNIFLRNLYEPYTSSPKRFVDSEIKDRTAEKMDLTDEQKSQIAEMFNKATLRDIEIMKENLELLKENPDTLTGYILALDAMKRGTISEEEYQGVLASSKAALKGLLDPGELNMGAPDPFYDAELNSGFTALLNPAQLEEYNKIHPSQFEGTGHDEFLLGFAQSRNFFDRSSLSHKHNLDSKPDAFMDELDKEEAKERALREMNERIEARYE